MDAFLAVARSLEIKEICTAETVSNDETKDYSSTNDQDTSTELLEEQTVISDIKNKQVPQERQRYLANVNTKFECDQCDKTYSSKGGLYMHKQSVHQGVKYACDQCDLQYTQKGDLIRHIQLKHEGVKYACDQCDYKATKPST